MRFPDPGSHKTRSYASTSAAGPSVSFGLDIMSGCHMCGPHRRPLPVCLRYPFFLRRHILNPRTAFPNRIPGTLNAGSMLEIVYRNTVCAARPPDPGDVARPLPGIPLHSIVPRESRNPGDAVDCVRFLFPISGISQIPAAQGSPQPQEFTQYFRGRIARNTAPFSAGAPDRSTASSGSDA